MFDPIRVRCIDASGWEFLEDSEEYTVITLSNHGTFVKLLEQPMSKFAISNGILYDWIPSSRFKIIYDNDDND